MKSTQVDFAILVDATSSRLVTDLQRRRSIMNNAIAQNQIQNQRLASATRIVASTFGGIVSIAGVMHGCFELLQGNVAPDGVVINAIGPGQRLWEYAALHALTLIPNLRVTGVLAIIVGLLATLWAVAFIGRKSGAWVMFALSIALFLVGGGFGPPFNGTFAALVASRINKPLTWWRVHLSTSAKDFLVKLWPGILVFYVLMFFLAVGTTIFGLPLTLLFDQYTTYLIVLRSGNFMLIVMLLSVLSAFAHDLQVAERRLG